jgi:hypothetical protein
MTTTTQQAIAERLDTIRETAHQLADSVRGGRAHPSYFDEKINKMRSLLTLVEGLAQDDDRGPDAILGSGG